MTLTSRLDALTPIQKVGLLTLRLRALDARSATPMLGDETAAALAEKLGLDVTGSDIGASMVLVHGLRALTLDGAVRAFIARHPDAVVLDLGAGLDTRAVRCAPPSTVDWYDIDLPEVVALRGELLSDAGHAIAADLADTSWLARIPADRPTIAVTDGLMLLLPGASFRAVLRAITAHAPHGEIAFNAYTPTAVRMGARGSGAMSVPVAGEGFVDAHTPETWDAGLTLAEELLQAHSPETARWPQPWRTISRISARIGPVARATDRVVRYSF